MAQGYGRLTQRDIARLAGVSQTTVSLILNGIPSVRVSDDTRQRVLRMIRETGYVADPLARRMQRQNNQILGVFTYEPVFPSATADFYHPFLVGIEEATEQFGYDLLLFTSAPVSGGQRRVFHENNRLRIADGSILLGRDVPADELARLVAERYPFVSVGRRDDAGGPVPYVGADYTSATEALVRRAYSLGHRRLAYLGTDGPAESAVDRYAGFQHAAAWGAHLTHLPDATLPAPAILDSLLAARVTAVFVDEYAVGGPLVTAARERGLSVPGDLSVVALGDPTRPVVVSDVPLTSFRLPRPQMGAQSVEVLHGLLHEDADSWQRLLPCELVDGTTLGAPNDNE